MRSFHDPWEPEDIFEREEAQRRREMAAEVIQRNQERIERESVEAEKRKEEARRFSLRAGAHLMLREYAAAGVEPLEVGYREDIVDHDGKPTPIPSCSLSMLLSIGWTIRDVDGHKTLLRPAPPPKRKTREDYDSERGMGT